MKVKIVSLEGKKCMYKGCKEKVTMLVYDKALEFYCDIHAEPVFW